MGMGMKSTDRLQAVISSYYIKQNRAVLRTYQIISYLLITKRLYILFVRV